MGSLPDDVLLKIFKLFIDEAYLHNAASQEWCTLVHVCRRWRDLAFSSPRHLNLRLLCETFKQSIDEMLDIWPELPIYVDITDYPWMGDRDNIVAALRRLNHRVSRICLRNTGSLTWGIFAPLMQHPFPALTHLWVKPGYSHLNKVPCSFLGGSAPFLQDLDLARVSFPELPELLLSSTNLVRLSYHDVPHSGYISPQEMATGLSALIRLESLSLTFRLSDWFPDIPVRITPPHSRALLPALTDLHFQGFPGYMDDLVAQIDTPSLEEMEISLFHREVLQVSELAKFVRCADKLSLVDRAEVIFQWGYIYLSLPRNEGTDRKTLILKVACSESNLRLSYLAQFFASCLPTLSPFKDLHIIAPYDPSWEDVIDNPDPQWLDLLCLFNSVEDLHLSYRAAFRVSKILRGLPAERAAEVLPALKNIFIATLSMRPDDPVVEAISEFADARGHPVSVDFWFED